MSVLAFRAGWIIVFYNCFLMFLKNYSFFLNIILFVFYRIKKTLNLTYYSCFSFSFFFFFLCKTKNSFVKRSKNKPLAFPTRSPSQKFVVI